MAKAVPADATVSVSQNLQGSAAQLLDEHARRIAAEFQLNTDQVAVLAHCSRHGVMAHKHLLIDYFNEFHLCQPLLLH